MALVTDRASGGRRREELVTAEGILCTANDGASSHGGSTVSGSVTVVSGSQALGLSFSVM